MQTQRPRSNEDLIKDINDRYDGDIKVRDPMGYVLLGILVAFALARILF